MTASIDTNRLRWLHNNGSAITKWNGLTSIVINNVRKADAGVYEVFEVDNRHLGLHAIMKVIVRGIILFLFKVLQSALEFKQKRRVHSYV